MDRPPFAVPAAATACCCWRSAALTAAATVCSVATEDYWLKTDGTHVNVGPEDVPTAAAMGALAAELDAPAHNCCWGGDACTRGLPTCAPFLIVIEKLLELILLKGAAF